MSAAAAPVAPVRDLAGPGTWLRLTAAAAAGGTLLAVVSGVAQLGTAHRVLAALAGPPLVALTISAWISHRHLLAPALVAGVSFALAAALTPRGAHVVFASVAFAASAVVLAQSFRGIRVPGVGWRDYLTLTKPRVMSLLLVTGFGAMILGARGWPGTTVAVAATVGLALACGGAGAFNHVLDRDIDRVMGKRTERRPVAAERIVPSRAIEFALALSAFSFVLLASAANMLTAVLALAGNLFYVLVYTRWLKRSTVQNIVIGGAAGAVPPLVGWAAATGNLDLTAAFLFLIVFVWTPPHFWALALMIKEHYARADVPMLPVVRGERETTRQIGLYSLALVATSVLPFLWHEVGLFYLGSALVLGGAFLVLAALLRVEASRRRAALLFHYSLLYLALLFVALALDPVL